MTRAVFDRGRSGSDEVWRTPTTLARHADASSVPIRECLAEVFKDAHVENDDPLDAVDADEMDEVYESLARSERIVGGYTRFGFEEKGAMRVYCTADPDAVKEEPKETVGVPFGNPLFRAEGELFANSASDGGTNPDPPPPRALAQSLRTIKTSARVPASARGHASGTPSTSRAHASLFAAASTGKRMSATATAPRRGPPGSATTLPRRPLFASTARPRRPPSHARASARADTRPRGSKSRPSDSPIRAPMDPEKAALVEKIEAVLGEVRARIHGDAGSVFSSPAKTTSLGARFAAVSRDRTAERGARRRAAMLEALARPALARWRSAARRASAEREAALLAKALAAFASTSTRAAFSRWEAFAEESREMRALLRRAVGKFASRTSSAALARWVYWVEDRKERRALFRRAMSWWKARSKTAAWLRWRDAVVDAQTARWAARFFVDRTRSAAFARWAEFADEARDARRVATRAVAHWKLCAARRAMATWAERAAALAADRERLTRAVARFRSRALAGAFERWDHVVVETHRSRELLRRAVTRFESRALAGAFGRWLDAAEEAREARETLGRAVGFWNHRNVAGAFTRWAEVVEQINAGRDMLRRAVGRFESKTRAAAMATWRDFARESAADRDATLRADAHFASRARAQGMGAFVHNLEAVLWTRHALAHWMHRTVARAWARWRVFGDERRAATRLDPEAFRFFRRRLLTRGFATWRERALELMLAREEWRLAEERHRHTALRRFANRWIARVRETVAAEDADEHRARVVAGECLSGWFREMRISHRRRENAARRCVRAWHRVAARRRVTRACLSVARARMYAKTTRAAFDAWSATWLREARATLGAALAARNAARRATRAWRAAAAASSLERRAGDAADRHARSRLVGRSFAALSSHWARKVLTRAFVYGRQKKLAARAWSGWASEAWEGRLRRVEAELGAVEALGLGGLDARRAAPSKGSPTRGFSMSHSPPGGPWLAAGPGKNSKAPIGDADKWKYY